MTTNKYTAKRNSHNQTIIVKTSEAHLPHILVSWYIAGMGESGTCAVREGETQMDAADRAFGARSKPNHFIVPVTFK